MGRVRSKTMESNAATGSSERQTVMVEASTKRGKPSGKKTAKKATATELKTLLDVQQYCCALFGLPLAPEDAALDHIVSVSDGGTHEVNNLQWLNTEVNRMKGSMSQSRFIAIVKLIAANT